jgi:hypothetical protein
MPVKAMHDPPGGVSSFVGVNPSLQPDDEETFTTNMEDTKSSIKLSRLEEANMEISAYADECKRLRGIVEDMLANGNNAE